jgi:hypothetical protein
MSTISTLSSTAAIDGCTVELNKVTRRDGVVSRYEVEFVERDFGYTLLRVYLKRLPACGMISLSRM